MKPGTPQNVNDGQPIDPHDLTFVAKITLSVGGESLYLTADPSYQPFSLGLAQSFSPNAVFAAYSLKKGTLFMFQQMNVELQAKFGAPLFVGFSPTGALGDPYILPILLGTVSPLSEQMFSANQFTVDGGLSVYQTQPITLWDNDRAGPYTINNHSYNLGQVGVGDQNQFLLFPGPGQQPSWNVTVLTPQPSNMDSADFNYTLLYNNFFVELSLKKAQFRNADLSGNFVLGCDLTDADLTGANLSGVQWGKVTLPNTLNGAKLLNTNLSGANFQGCIMAGVDLTGAIFSPGTTFAGADLSNAVFSPNANLQGVDFTDAILSGAALTGADLRGAKFSPKVVAHGTKLSNANFTGDNLNGVDFTGATLTQATLTGATLKDANINGADLTGATAQNVDFTSTGTPGTQLAGTNFSGVDLTTASFDASPHFSTDPTKLTRFNNAKLNYAAISKNWSYLDLTGATVAGLPQALSSGAQPLIAQYVVINSFNAASGELSKKILQSADFSNASIGGVDMTGSDLTGAKFDQATLSATILDGAILEQISAEGAQFGGLDPKFDLDLSAQSALNSGSIADLAPFFEPHGITLSTGTTVTKSRALWKITDPGSQQTYAVTKEIPAGSAAVITVYAASPFTVDLVSYPNCEADLDTWPKNASDLIAILGHYNVQLPANATITLETASWSIVDEENNGSYTAIKDTTSEGVATIGVYASSATVSLAGAHLSNAIMESSGLYGAAASHSDFYGENTNLKEANLEDADFSNANLGEANLQHAQMQGAVLDNASLVNANLQGAYLTRGASGKVASLTYANLQGVNFQDALLYSADLKNAAVAVNIGSGSDPVGGVYLFSLPASDKPLLDQATNQFKLNPGGDLAQFSQFLQALNDQNVALLQPVFKKHGLDLSASAKITAATSNGKSMAWQIEDGQMGYTVWSFSPPELEVYGVAGAFSLNPTGDPTVFNTLLTALNNQNLPPLQTAFAGQHHTVDDTATIQTVEQGLEWTLSSDSSVYNIYSSQNGEKPNDILVVPQFSLNPASDHDLYTQLVAALNNNDVSSLQTAFAKQNYTLADGAQVQSSGVQWNIVDQKTSYIAWLRGNDDGNPVIHAGPSNAELAKAFGQNYELQPLATIEHEDGSGWFVDNDSDNPAITQTGYVKLQIVDRSDLSPSSLDVYGTTIRIKRILANGKDEFDDAECQVTTLSAENMGPDTVCPNGHKYSTNQATPNTSWNDWMRAQPGQTNVKKRARTRAV